SVPPRSCSIRAIAGPLRRGGRPCGGSRRKSPRPRWCGSWRGAGRGGRSPRGGLSRRWRRVLWALAPTTRRAHARPPAARSGATRSETDGQPTDSLGQLLDTVTVEGRFLSALAAPVGLRYHALHHYLATVPYHSLGALHRLLLAELPADDPYRRTRCSGVMAAAVALARRAAARRSR